MHVATDCQGPRVRCHHHLHLLHLPNQDLAGILATDVTKRLAQGTTSLARDPATGGCSQASLCVGATTTTKYLKKGGRGANLGPTGSFSQSAVCQLRSSPLQGGHGHAMVRRDDGDARHGMEPSAVFVTGSRIVDFPSERRRRRATRL
ncbi:hypothetical protein G7046_g8482 [Stylonectria norvegica]|nr:hypothetical protein G7046_g8482 [Stylonectria norvegica]